MTDVKVVPLEQLAASSTETRQKLKDDETKLQTFERQLAGHETVVERQLRERIALLSAQVQEEEAWLSDRSIQRYIAETERKILGTWTEPGNLDSVKTQPEVGGPSMSLHPPQEGLLRAFRLTNGRMPTVQEARALLRQSQSSTPGR